MIAGVETGGTKVLCAIAHAERPEEIVRRRLLPTTDPVQTLAAITAFLEEAIGDEPLEGLGIAAFGPLDLSPSSPSYGSVTSTPKRGWEHTSLLSIAPGVPTRIVTDVTGAAIGEHRWGAGRGFDRLAYITVGTGIGAGLILDGAPMIGTGYPEVGNLLVRRHPDDDFAGVGRYRSDTVEGLASGPAIAARWGADGSSLDAAAQALVHEVIGYYIAQLIASIDFAVGLDRVVLGGGVLLTPGLLGAVRSKYRELTGGTAPRHEGRVEQFIVSPELGTDSGVQGALALAQELLPAARAR